MKRYEEPSIDVLVPLSALIMEEGSGLDLDIPVVGGEGDDPFTE